MNIHNQSKAIRDLMYAGMMPYPTFDMREYVLDEAVRTVLGAHPEQPWMVVNQWPNRQLADDIRAEFRSGWAFWSQFIRHPATRSARRIIARAKALCRAGGYDPDGIPDFSRPGSIPHRRWEDYRHAAETLEP